MLINEIAAEVTAAPELTPQLLRKGQAARLLRRQIGKIRGMSADVVRGVRHALGHPAGLQDRRHLRRRVRRAPRRTTTPPTTRRTEVAPREKEAVIILGSGPNRIGQGIEFDYSCVHAAMALRDAGYETVMVNCNPETVSTDYDTSDRLYFEPLTLEDVLEVVHAEQQAGPVAGVIVQLGGQTPLGLAQGLEDAGVPIVGTSPGGDPPGRGARRVRPGAGRGRVCPPRSTAWRPRSRRRRRSRRDRLPGAGAAVLRARRPRHGDRLRRPDRWRATSPAPPRSARAPGAGRPVPRRRGRDRRRRALRRRGALPRRRHGAHRGGRHPLRRLRLRAAADHPRRRGDRADPRQHRWPSPAASACVGLLNVQYALASGVLYVLEANPRASAHGAVRLQGDERHRWPRPRPG